MKAEVAIVNGNPWEIYEGVKENQKIGERDHIFTEFKPHLKEGWQWDRDKNGNPKAIHGDPQYIAIHVNGTHSFRAILEIDSKNSRLNKGLIVAEGEPLHVYIPIKFSQDRLQGIRYTTFRTLLTHESTTEFKTLKEK